MAYNAKCSICGRPYHKCNDCYNSKLKPWLSIVDSINHYKIYMIISDYTNKKINKVKANELLGNCDISNYKEFVLEIVEVIEEITEKNKGKTYVNKTSKSINKNSGEYNESIS